MTSLTRSLSQLAGVRSAVTRRLALAIGSIAILSAALLLGAAPAGAVVKTVGGQTYGIAPADPTGVADHSYPMTYEGGPVVHSSASYLLFWAPQTHPTAEYPQGAYSGESERIIGDFFHNLAEESGVAEGGVTKRAATSNVFAVATQYREGATGSAPAYISSFRGAYTATDPFPANAGEECALGTICLTSAEIRSELVKYIAANSLPSGLNPTTGATPIYFVLTPPGIDVAQVKQGPIPTARNHRETRSAAITPSFPQKTDTRRSSMPSYRGVPATTARWVLGPWSLAATARMAAAHCKSQIR